MLKYFNIMIIAFAIIISIILIKYKPIYKISVSGEELGYIENKQALEEKIKENVIEKENKNVDSIEINTNPEYEFKLVDRSIETNETEILEAIEPNITVTYKYYEINLENQELYEVNTLAEAEQLVNKIKEENQEKQLQLTILEKYTENVEEVKTQNIEIAESEIQTKVTQELEKQKNKNVKKGTTTTVPEINGIKLAYTPITGTITSRYGSIESVRNSRTHTGLDIAAITGTEIRAMASGTVTFSGVEGGYGNIVKLDHGNGVETYYAHCSKLYVTKGQKVEAGKVIAAVGSTGHSTGPHLHLEIRINNQTVNPQKYLYK